MNLQTMKHFFLITWMASLLCSGAEINVTTELVRPIIEASDRSFPDFVKASIAVEIPALPLPNTGGDASPLAAVSTLVWKRISTVDEVIKTSNKNEKLELMQSMGKLRGWLLKHGSYTNLFFAAYIEDAVSMSAVAALSDGKISVEEARKMMASLAPGITSEALFAAVQQCVPGSAALHQIKDAGVSGTALLEIGERIEKELSERLEMKVDRIIEQERPASLAFYVALSSSTTRMAAILINLAAKGGDLSLIDGKIAKEVKRLMPEVIGSVDPATGMKIEAVMFRGLMQNVSEWKSRH